MTTSQREVMTTKMSRKPRSAALSKRFRVWGFSFRLSGLRSQVLFGQQNLQELGITLLTLEGLRELCRYLERTRSFGLAGTGKSS